MRVHLIAALVLTVPAMALAPLEQRIHRERNRLKYGSAKAALTLHDRISQNAWIALLAGFRGVVADFIWIQGHQFWENKQWLRQYRTLETTVMLQPQSILFWDVGAWHMAWNIGYAERVDTNNLTQAQGLKRERIWHERARDFLLRGIENIPNRFDLYFKLGWLYQQKFKDDCAAAACFAKALGFADAPAYVGNEAARAFERCGDVAGAYKVWVKLWRAGRTPFRNVIEREIKRLEYQLNVPDNERVFPKHSTVTPPPSP